jgi:transcriptional regulator with GAF, ATPase, and Fis domain
MSTFTLDETQRVAPDRGARRVLSIELVVIEGPSRGARVAIRDGNAKVGTAEGSDLRLADSSVSRVHCELQVRAETVTVRDLGSTNGTFVDDVRVRDADVPPGALIRVGGSAFRIEAGDAPSFVALSSLSEFGELYGDSIEMRGVYALLERASPTDTTLLICGETGTGKDVAARSVHHASNRAAGPFIPVDCGAIPENLIESELFGHVRGAFTGAIGNRKGAFEEAHGGTLFLDEIGEMPLSMQPKLLRALESRSIRRVGETRAVPVDVRVIAATNRDLARAVNEGTFREDLYYRLAVVPIVLPPLRARRDDIPMLAQRFFTRLRGAQKAASSRSSADAEELPPELLAQLRERQWPGNVRELRNHVERLVTLGQWQSRARPGDESGKLPAPAPSVLPAGIESIVPLHLPLKDARLAWTEEFESVYVRAMLKRTGGNLTHAADLAGVSRRFLQRLIARLELHVEIEDPEDD